MPDHYHYASEIQGAAADNHSHSARDVGAADDHDFEMLKRDMHAAEATIAVLERQNNRQHTEIQELKGRVADLEEYCRQHSENFTQLGRQVETIARHLADGRR